MAIMECSEYALAFLSSGEVVRLYLVLLLAPAQYNYTCIIDAFFPRQGYPEC